MNNNLIKISLGLILAVGSAQAADTRTFRNGYYFQHVSKIDGNLTATAGKQMENKITVINTDQTWKSDTIYILDNLTFVEAPATLTIEPGTIVRGATMLKAGSSTLDPTIIGDLNICRGAKLVAKGTADSPIIFTSFYDSLVPGGRATIPNDKVGLDGALTTISDSTINSEAAYYEGVDSVSGAAKAHKLDAQWGSLTLLGRAFVGFGGASANSGILQVGIKTDDRLTQAYTENPTFTFDPSSYSSGSSGFNLEPLFNPVGVASVYFTSKGKFTGEKPILKATAAAGSRTGVKTVFGTVTVSLNDNGTGQHADTTSTFAAGDDYWEVTDVAITTPGTQYNVPTQKESAPFLDDYGYTSAQIAFQFDGADSRNVTKTTADGVSAAVGSVKGSLSINGVKATGVTTLPVAKMRLSPTYLYGVIVKAPAAYTLTSAPTLAVSGGNSSVHAKTECSLSTSPVSQPSAIPLKSGIGANFIEGKQAIDAGAYGFSTAPTVDSDGLPWLSFSGGIYGGDKSNDNSGTISFIQLRHGGYELSPNNEINGLTMGGVGSGTYVDYVEVFNNADDDFEMFGGSVNLKHVAAMFGGDDMFDTDMGFNGKGQYMMGVANNTVGSTSAKKTGRNKANIGDNLGENDGNEDPNTITNGTYPGTEFTYFNMTMIGIGYTVATGNTFATDRQGPNFKDNSGGKVFNSIYVEAPSGAFCDQSTVAEVDSTTKVGARRIVSNPFGNNGQALLEPQGVLAFDTWAKCGGGEANVTANYTDKSFGGPLFPRASARSSSGGGTVNAQPAVTKTLVSDLSNEFLGTDVLKSIGTNGRLEGVDPRLPTVSSQRTSGTNPRASAVVAPGVDGGLSGTIADRGGFFAPTKFRGACKDFNWTEGWTHAGELGVFANNTVVVPEVTLTRDGSGNVVATFFGADGIQYIIETSSDNKTFVPLNETTIVGANDNISRNLGGSGSLLFVRVNPQ
jgi:hypothetical protein